MTEHYLLCVPRLKVEIKYVSTENEQLSFNEELQNTKYVTLIKEFDTYGVRLRIQIGMKFFSFVNEVDLVD